MAPPAGLADEPPFQSVPFRDLDLHDSLYQSAVYLHVVPWSEYSIVTSCPHICSAKIGVPHRPLSYPHYPHSTLHKINAISPPFRACHSATLICSPTPHKLNAKPSCRESPRAAPQKINARE